MNSSVDGKLPLLTVNDLQVNIAGQIILDKINLKVSQGQIVTIIGPNGAGKSTLVRAILGLIKPTFGTVTTRAGIRIGYMPQKLMLESLMPITVHRFLTLNNNKKFASTNNNHTLTNNNHGIEQANICNSHTLTNNSHRIEQANICNSHTLTNNNHGIEQANICNSHTLHKADRVLQELKIQHLLSSPLQKISGGELQRVLLARALLNEPDLLVLDEPVQGVDITGQTELYGLINDVCSKHKVGILMVSHDLHLVMARTDEVICLNKHICCSGHPQAVSSNPQFLSLFGEQSAVQLAVYAHHHNHKHDLAGKIVNEK